MTGSRSPRDLDVRVAASPQDQAAHFHVRHDVFVAEQEIFTGTDRDRWDDSAIHVVASDGPIVVGAVRLYPLDEAGLWRGDRLAVLRHARGGRVGAPLVRYAVATAGRHGGHLMIARIQAPNVAFFLHLGWRTVGDPDEYRGLTHQDMCIDLSGAPPAFSEEGYAWALGAGSPAA